MLMHISSLPSGYSIGSLGKCAYRFVDFLSNSGFSYWQVLPLGVTDSYGSPYKSRGFYSLNPYFIDIEELYSEGLLTFSELISAKENTPYLAEYERLASEREALLYSAAMRVTNRTATLDFINKHPDIGAAAYFLALKDTYAAPWRKWARDCVPDGERLFFWQFLHFEFYKEWQRLKAYANSHGVELIGDMPIYPDYESADVWGRPECFLLDKNMLPREVAGVPPDCFSSVGQLWGNPVYNFTAMRKDGFEFWHRRFKFAFEMYDAVRIDHFRAFDAYYAIPRTVNNAAHGRWKRGPGREFIDALNMWRADKTVIAEDLGEITDSVRNLLEYSGLACTRVIQFGAPFGGAFIHLPHAYSSCTFAYTGTHDNNTLLGAVWEMGECERRRLFEYFGIRHNDYTLACEDIIKGLMRSSATAVIIPVQDILGFGADTRMNTPGRREGNWRYRITDDNLCYLSENFEKWKNINLLYDR